MEMRLIYLNVLLTPGLKTTVATAKMLVFLVVSIPLILLNLCDNVAHI